MKKKYYCSFILILVLSVLLFCLSSCGLAHLIESAKMKNYYSEKSNYINVIGTVADIEYSEGGDLLILEFDEDIAPADIFTSRKFLIEGENLLTIKTSGFDEKVKNALTNSKLYSKIDSIKG